MTWVFSHSTAAGADRLLLLAIADHAGDDGGDAWPSVPTLARKTGISERSVQRGVARLEAGGHLAVERGAGRGGTNRYRVVMDGTAGRQSVTGDDLTPPQVSGPVGDDLAPGDDLTPVTELCHRGGDTQVSPERPLRPSSPLPPKPAGKGVRTVDTLAADGVGAPDPMPQASRLREASGKVFPEPGKNASDRRRTSRATSTNPRTVQAAQQRADRQQAQVDRVAERRLRQQAITGCPRCSATGYLPGGRVCDHDPEAAERAARGMALVREQLARRTAVAR